MRARETVLAIFAVCLIGTLPAYAGPPTTNSAPPPEATTTVDLAFPVYDPANPSITVDTIRCKASTTYTEAFVQEIPHVGGGEKRYQGTLYGYSSSICPTGASYLSAKVQLKVAGVVKKTSPVVACTSSTQTCYEAVTDPTLTWSCGATYATGCVGGTWGGYGTHVFQFTVPTPLVVGAPTTSDGSTCPPDGVVPNKYTCSSKTEKTGTHPT